MGHIVSLTAWRALQVLSAASVAVLDQVVFKLPLFIYIEPCEVSRLNNLLQASPCKTF